MECSEQFRFLYIRSWDSSFLRSCRNHFKQWKEQKMCGKSLGCWTKSNHTRMVGTKPSSLSYFWRTSCYQGNTKQKRERIRFHICELQALSLWERGLYPGPHLTNRAHQNTLCWSEEATSVQYRGSKELCTERNRSNKRELHIWSDTYFLEKRKTSYVGSCRSRNVSVARPKQSRSKNRLYACNFHKTDDTYQKWNTEK